MSEIITDLFISPNYVGCTGALINDLLQFFKINCTSCTSYGLKRKKYICMIISYIIINVLFTKMNTSTDTAHHKFK